MGSCIWNLARENIHYNMTQFCSFKDFCNSFHLHIFRAMPNKEQEKKWNGSHTKMTNLLKSQWSLDVQDFKFWHYWSLIFTNKLAHWWRIAEYLSSLLQTECWRKNEDELDNSQRKQQEVNEWGQFISPVYFPFLSLSSVPFTMACVGMRPPEGLAKNH